MTFEKGNKFAQEWTLENAQPRFEDALTYAKENKTCLCLQDAIFETGIPVSTFYHLAENQPVLETIKKEIHAHIISRINKNALDKMTPAPASPSIWRMKQLGEKDQQYIDQNVNSKNETVVQVIDEKTSKNVDKLKKKFKSE